LTFKVEEGITLDCDHRFDMNCLQAFIEGCIAEGRVGENEISCLVCAHPISAPIIKSLVSRNMYEKFEKFRLRMFVPKEEDEENIVFYKCNGNDCEWFVIVGLDLEVVVCQSCRKKSCPKCRDEPHVGITCEENERQKKEKAEKAKEKAIDDEFKLAAKAMGFKTCPHCLSMCERISGCNFMKCYSKACGGKKNFCLLCERAITDAQHYSHYKAQGPFGKTCNGLDGTPE
jgi:hypothetical protein